MDGKRQQNQCDFSAKSQHNGPQNEQAASSRSLAINGLTSSSPATEKMGVFSNKWTGKCCCEPQYTYRFERDWGRRRQRPGVEKTATGLLRADEDSSGHGEDGRSRGKC
ncbi:hypothetical protein Adt_44946 [Abeliophyllum distichum]|uniref:Uncharacterized protein n=1 Tax=Abeliophyllum distichum TaxID=126358 RepID=A0ABD1PCB2_9LAMI